MMLQIADTLPPLQGIGEYGTKLDDYPPLLTIYTKSDDTSILVINAYSHNIIRLNVAKKKISVDTRPTIGEQIIEQAPDEYCKAASFNVYHAGAKIHFDHCGLLVRESIVK